MAKKRVKNEKRGLKPVLETHKRARKYATILGVRVDGSELVELLSHILNLVQTHKKFLVVTPNPEIVILARHDTVLYSILNSADICLPDGVGLVWASRWGAFCARSPQPAVIDKRVSGVDVMEKLVTLASERGWRVFLLGGKQGVAEEAAHRLACQYPNILVHWDSGPWLNNKGEPIDVTEAKKETEVVCKINEFKPNILFIAFGAPKQEKWASRNLRSLDVNCTMVVGGAFDYISGRVPRAPRWMQKAGLEWLFRSLVEPWRIRRQLALVSFAWAVLTSRK